MEATKGALRIRVAKFSNSAADGTLCALWPDSPELPRKVSNDPAANDCCKECVGASIILYLLTGRKRKEGIYDTGKPAGEPDILSEGGDLLLDGTIKSMEWFDEKRVPTIRGHMVLH